MITIPLCPPGANIPAQDPPSGCFPPPPSEPPAAFVGRLYAKERSFVRGVLLRAGVPVCDADDLGHEVFIIAQRRIDGLDRTQSLRPWLYVTAIQVAASYRKQARHRLETYPGELPQGPCVPCNVEAELIAEEERRDLHRRVHGLGSKLRAVVVPYAFEGRTMGEVAHALGIPEKTAYARLRLAHAAFARRMRRAQ